MITQVAIDNFKSFKHAEFQVKSLNIMAGINSSGKSSIIQALRLLGVYNSNQSPLEQHGGYSDIRCIYADVKQEICIGVSLDNKEMEYFDGFYQTVNPTISTTILETIENAQYIAADRLGPQVSFHVPQSQRGQTVGERGENVILYCISHKDTPITDGRQHPRAAAGTFEYHLEEWMNEISPGVKLDFFNDTRIDTGAFRVGQKGDLTISQRPTNVGFGVSYTLPVVAALMGAKSGDLLFIENPEAHLHPVGQTKIGELLARTAHAGVQLFVETHSDHLVDGVRIAIRDELLKSDDATVLFCSKSNKTNLSQIDELRIESNGDMSSWPTGFCDQSIKNLSKLAEF